MTFKEDMEAMLEIEQRSKLTDHTRFEERWGHTTKFKTPSSAAGVEKAVVKFLNMKGHQASKTEVKPTVLKGKDYKAGAYTIKGKDTHITSGATKGQADLSSSIYGLAVHWELKYSPTDRQSAVQKKFEQKVQNSGALYFIFHNCQDFYEIYQELMEYPQIKLMKNYHEKNGK